MKTSISPSDAGKIFKTALEKGLLDREDSSVIFYDLSFMAERFGEVKRLFPPASLHTAAIKANPLIEILKIISSSGAGAEAASYPEIYIAEKSGFPAGKIVFDSPAKTADELRYALQRGVSINADSLEELEIIDSLLKESGSSSSIGLRINPQVGTGKIAITSVAGEYSKFGVPVNEFRNEIIEAYKKYEWLTGIHLHVGSQGCPLELLLKGVGVVYELAVGINSLLNVKRIKTFDLGGGYPVNYKKEEPAPPMQQYAEGIKNNFPLLFNGEFNLITEFGRYYFANSAFALSRIDNIKRQKGISTIVSHLGADFMLRRVYHPESWHHDMSVLAPSGEVKTGGLNNYVVGGPLCFAGDVIAKDISLPEAVPGDYLLISDVGAYTLSMWSRYNSRQIPKVIGYYNNGEEILILKERETPESVLKFWSRDNDR